MRQQLDSVTLEILWTRLVSIADEAATAFVRSSFSPLVREANDYAVVLTDVHGSSLSQSSLSIPSFIATLPRTVRHFLSAFPPSGLADGDVLITNDPWMGTGHIHDISTAAPIFHRGRLVAFSAVTSHVPDIGGRIRSSDVPSIYEEGLQIPRLKLLHGGRTDEALVAMIRQNVRVPDQTMGDLWGQVSAHQMIRQRLTAILDETGLDLEQLGVEICRRSEEALRAAIRAVPNGVYRHVVNHDGFGKPLVIDCKVHVTDDELLIDYAGSSPEVDSKSINVVETYTYAYTAFGVKALLSPDVPNNEGSFRPLKVTAPAGSVLNARFPVGTGARGQIGHLLPPAVFGALGTAVRGAMAEGSGNCVVTTIGEDQGRHFAISNFVNAGQGATASRDGYSAFAFPSNLGNNPIEVIESEAPMLVRHRRLRRGSGGRGQHNGGDGISFAFDYLGERPAQCSFLMTRRIEPPHGGDGGEPGKPSVLTVNGRVVAPTDVKMLSKGDQVVLETAGGGGFGRPAKR